jgi:glycosyltransferase involved in cell wall biosynthesis
MGVSMYKNRTIAVVVPAYNEENLISDTLKSIPQFVDRIFVVNDGSEDSTGIKIDELSRHDPRISHILHERNKGVGAAVISGYKRSLADEFDITVVMDGDNQMDPKYVAALLDPIVDGKADYTKGNRLLNPDYRKGMSKWRLFGNSILTILTKFSSGYWQLMDPQNAFTAISRDVLARIDLDSVYSRYGYPNDLLAKMNVFGFRVINVPHPARYGKEKSKIKYGRYILKVSNLLLMNFFWRLKTKYILINFHPLIFFYIFGILMVPLGVIGGIYTIHNKLLFGEALFIRGVLSALLAIIGIQLFLFAMLFDMQNENYRI